MVLVGCIVKVFFSSLWRRILVLYFFRDFWNLVGSRKIKLWRGELILVLVLIKIYREGRVFNDFDLGG